MCKEWHKGRPRCFVSHWKFYNCIRVFINELLLHREQKMHFTVKIKTLPVRCLFQWKQSCVICFDVWRASVCDHLEMNRRFRSQLDNVRCLNSWCSALGFSLCCMSCRLFSRNEACSIHMTNTLWASNGIRAHVWNIALLHWPVQPLH